MSDIILIKGKVLIETADIQEVRGLEYKRSIESERSDKMEQVPFITRLSDYQGKPDYDLTGKFVVRVFLRSAKSENSSFPDFSTDFVSKTPFIDIVCDSLPEAQQLYKNILKSRHIVDINEMRYGK